MDDRIRFIFEGGIYVVTARVSGVTQTFRLDPGMLEELRALRDGRLSRVTLDPWAKKPVSELPMEDAALQALVARTRDATLAALRDGLIALAPVLREAVVPEPGPKEEVPVAEPEPES